MNVLNCYFNSINLVSSKMALLRQKIICASEYIYNYRDGSGIKYKGTPFNTAGWTSVEVVGQIIEKIGPILATKYNEVY